MHETKLNITAHTGPTSLAASALADVKAHLRVDTTHEDDVISDYFAAAMSFVQDYCRITIEATTWDMHLPAFPRLYRYIGLPRGTVTSVDFLKYYDTDGVLVEWSSEDYYLALGELPAKIYLHGDDNWEDTQTRPDAVQVRYSAGFSSWSSVPAMYRQPLYYLTGHYYKLREPVVTGTIATALPFALQSNLQSIRQDFSTG
tara:strand:+ start:956 stop:1558 length:603 start_codon:yes stop_codon:yes gene_type:complete